MVQYEAGAHEAQMKILRVMLLANSNKFADLARAAGMSNDHANFHLQQLVKNGYVCKALKTYGEYELTRAGKEYANRMDTDEAQMEKQPKLSVVVVLERNDGTYLQQQRLKQPYYGFWGHLTGKIRWGETMLEAGARELHEETGLTATLRVAGFYHKLDYDSETGELLEDKYFCIIHGVDPQGELLEYTDGQHNTWMTLEEFDAKDKKFGSVAETIELVTHSETSIAERKYQYDPTDY